MLPADNPVLGHYEFFTSDEPQEPGADQRLPKVTAEDIRELNRALDELPDDQIGFREVDIAWCNLTKAMALSRAPKSLLRECAEVMARAYLSQETDLHLHVVLAAEEELSFRDVETKYRLYMRAAAKRPAESPEKIQLLETGLASAKKLTKEAPSEWACQAAALCELGFAHSASGDHAAAQDAFTKALRMSDERVDEDHRRVKYVRARALCGMGQLSLARGDLDDAADRLEGSDSILRGLVGEEHDDAVEHELARVLKTRATLARQCRQHGEATGLLNEALAAARLPASLRAGLLRDLGSVTQRTDGKSAAERLLMGAPAQHGMAVAALAGHEGARRIMAGEWPGFGEGLAEPETSREDRSLEELEALDLAELLTLDPTLVSLRVREIEQQAGDQPNGDWTKAPYGDLEIWQAWRALQVLQRLAVMVHGKRKALRGQEWSIASQVEGEPRKRHPLQVRLETGPGLLTARLAITVLIDPYDEPPEAWVEGRSVADKLSSVREELQGGAIAGQPSWQRAQVDWSFRWRGCTLEDIEVLSALCAGHAGGQRWRISGGPPGEDTGHLSFYCREGDHYCRPADPSGHDADLILTGSEPVEPAVGKLVVRVANAIQVFFRSLALGQPRIRYCQMPHGHKTYLDVLLGEPDVEVDSCGTFYIATYETKGTCGKATCTRYSGELIGLARAMMRRAEELAEQEFKRRAPLGAVFLDVWDVARQAHKDDAKAALAEFRYLLSGTQ